MESGRSDALFWHMLPYLTWSKCFQPTWSRRYISRRGRVIKSALYLQGDEIHKTDLFIFFFAKNTLSLSLSLTPHIFQNFFKNSPDVQKNASHEQLVSSKGNSLGEKEVEEGR